MLQCADMKQLKEKCDIGDKDELQLNTAARTPIKKNKVVCVICIQTFAIKKKMVEKFI